MDEEIILRIIRTALSLAIVYFSVKKVTALAGNSRTGDGRAQRGMAAYVRKDYVTAAEELRQATILGVKQIKREDVYTVLGKAERALGQRERAIASFEKALSINPGHVSGWLQLGLLHDAEGKVEEAEACYRKALAAEPQSAEAYNNLGALYIHGDEPERAIGHLQRAVALDPRLAVAHGNLAAAYAMAGRPAEADAEVQLAIRRGYDDPDVLREYVGNLKSLQGTTAPPSTGD